jgi:hypothetical protein
MEVLGIWNSADNYFMSFLANQGTDSSKQALVVASTYFCGSQYYLAPNREAVFFPNCIN